MSPILVRPVREQLEHDRVIRLLQAKYKRKFEVAINPGSEQSVGVGPGPSQWYPDLVLQTSDRNHKLAGVVEVETTESVNNLEAMSQWAAFGRLRVPFHLYLPTGSVDSARRFCSDLSIPVAELWAYQSVGDQLRFTLVQRSGQAPDGPRAAEPAAEARRKAPGRPTPAPRPAAGAAAPRRANGQAARRPVASRPSAARPAARRPAPKPAKAAKAAASRRTAAAKTAGRKTAKPASSRAQSRAQKRR